MSNMNNFDRMITYSTLDEDGNRIDPRNTMDGLLQWEVDGEANGSVYSDHLWTWNSDKHNILCQKHFGDQGQYWDNRDPEKIEAFLRDYNANPALQLVSIREYLNQSNGYPCWRFDYNKG